MGNRCRFTVGWIMAIHIEQRQRSNNNLLWSSLFYCVNEPLQARLHLAIATSLRWRCDIAPKSNVCVRSCTVTYSICACDCDCNIAGGSLCGRFKNDVTAILNVNGLLKGQKGWITSADWRKSAQVDCAFSLLPVKGLVSISKLLCRKFSTGNIYSTEIKMKEIYIREM